MNKMNNTKIGNNLISVRDSFKETARSSLQLSKTKNRIITALDFVMQVQPNWMYYLVYTAIRCATLAFEYKNSPEEKRYEVWEKAQLYSSVKVVGLVVSQIALTALGLTTLTSVSMILCWGLVLASASCYAHNKAEQTKLSE